MSSNIKAGGTAALIATGDAASGKGNVNIIGSNIDAKDVLLQANNQVNVLSSKDTESTRSDNESKSGSFGVSFGTGGWGVSASLSKSTGDANSDSTFQNNSHINASNTAVIVSGGDTNIVGGNVSRLLETQAIDSALNLVLSDGKVVLGGFGSNYDYLQKNGCKCDSPASMTIERSLR